jgi:hypothetical protein
VPLVLFPPVVFAVTLEDGLELLAGFDDEELAGAVYCFDPY